MKRSLRRFSQNVLNVLTLVSLGFVLSVAWAHLSLASGVIHPPQGTDSRSVIEESENLEFTQANIKAGILANAIVSSEQQGNHAYQLGDMAAAKTAWQEALEQYRSQSDPLGQARVLSNLSLAHQALGNWQEAETAIAQSLTFLQPSPSPLSQSLAQNTSPLQQATLAQALNTRGKLDFERGQAQDALEQWAKATQIYQQTGDPTGALRSQLNQVQALKNLGAYRKALQLAEQLQETIQALPNTSLKVAGLLQSGELLRIAGDTQQAQQLLKESFALAQTLNLSVAASEAQFNLGTLAQTQGDSKTALKHYEQASQIGDPLSIPLQLAKLRLFTEQQNSTAIQQLWPKIQQQLNVAPINHNTLFQQIALAHELLRNTKIGDSNASHSNAILPIEGWLNTVIINAQGLGDIRAESYAKGTLGQFYIAKQDLKQAEQQLQQALILAQGIPAPEMVYRWQWKLALVMKESGRMEAAIAHYNAAITTLKGLQNDLIALNPDVLFSFDEDVEPLYREFVALLMDESDRQSSSTPNRSNPTVQGQMLQATPLQQAKLASRQYLNQTATVMQTLHLSEMSNFLGEDCFQLQQSQAQAIEEIDERAAIIYPIIREHQLDILLHLPNQPLRHYKTEIEQQTLNTLLKRLNHYLVVRSRRQFRPLAQQLYNLMLRPLEEDLDASNIETLVFSLDRNLQGIPMAALHNGEQYLVEKYAIAITPSLQLFDTQPLNSQSSEILAVGLSEARNGFAALPFVRTELDNIQTQFPRSATLLDRGFTHEALRQKLRSRHFPIVHIATHGQVSSRPDSTFLLAWDQTVNVKQLDQMLQAPHSSQQQAIELLVLSACETAVEDERGTLGLAGLAIQSGARSTIGSLWKVNDQATAELMQAFYRHLSGGETRSQALRQAQLDLIHRKDYQHPIYWAPYILVGSWL